MKGMETLLKMFGFSQESVKAEVAKALAVYELERRYFDDRLSLIIRNQNIIAAASGINLLPSTAEPNGEPNGIAKRNERLQ